MCQMHSRNRRNSKCGAARQMESCRLKLKSRLSGSAPAPATEGSPVGGRFSVSDGGLQPSNPITLELLVQRCKLILTDSGGLQEEAPGLHKPVLVLRETTERPEAVAAGAARVVGTDPGRIVSAVRELMENPVLYAQMTAAPNPYGDGHAAERIVEALLATARPQP